MTFLLVFGLIVAASMLFLVDRVLKARGQARRVRRMSERLAAATVRAEEQQAKRQAAVAASGALTSVVPAINHPALALPGQEDKPGPAGDYPAGD
jgi:dolichol kinase